MFNFTTTHVVNDASFAKKVNNDKTARLVRGLDLNLDGILAVYKTPAEEGTPAELKLDALDALDAGERYKIELRPIDPANSTFANALVDKNKIIYVEGPIAINDDGVPAICEAAKKFQLFLYGEELLVPDADPATKVVAAPGVDIVKVEKEVLNSTSGSVVKPEFWEVDSDFTDDAVTPGKNEFGTYNWLIHNLRLPTGANMAWMNPNAEEMPIPGKKYTQYTIHYEQNRGILGMNAVGELSRSHTVHVFYVLADPDPDQDQEAKFEAALDDIDIIETNDNP